MFTKIVFLIFFSFITSAQAFTGSNTEYLLPEDFSYSINLLCINRELDISQQYFCKEKYFNDVLVAATKWSMAHPQASVNIWYDALLSSPESIKNSKRAWEERTLRTEVRNVKFRDIREIKAVSRNQDLFSEQMGLWYRIDLLKLIICLHGFLEDHKDSVIFTDADVLGTTLNANRMYKEHLFSPVNTKKLQVAGMLKGGDENQFLQFVADKNMIRALRLTINVNLMRGAFVLNIPEDGTIWKDISVSRRSVYSMIYNSVFFDTVNALPRYFYAIKFGQIEILSTYLKSDDGCTEWIPYNENKHGYEALGNYYINDYKLSVVVFSDDREIIPSSDIIRLIDEKGAQIYSSPLDTKHSDVGGFCGNFHSDIMPSKRAPADGSLLFKYETI